MSAAALAYGRTIILGAACEPEVVALGTALNSLGARIAGLGTERIEINGVESLAGGRVENIPDRIEAATLLIAGAITGGTVKVTGALASHLDQVLAVLDDSGAEITVRHEATSDTIAIRVPRRLRAMSVITQPYPGVPTDVQPLLTALWGHMRGLRRLGAKVVKQAQGCTVQGVPSLQGASTRGTDLRGTAALVLAALAADGSSRISGLQHLDRGYDRLEFKLAQLGAPVERVAFRQHQPVAAR
jgi:UDP-N-acetylglucosamine 1-carboxyvinyltransferase